MVRRQGSRFGVVTNHSVRRSNITSKNQEGNQYVVVKKMSKAPHASKKSRHVLEEFSQQVQDGNLAVISDDNDETPNPILYSLNKHRRWELPEMLKENILEEENHEESKFQLILSERHISVGGKDITARSGDCIGIHQTKCDHLKRIPKNTYSFESDLKASEKKNGRKKQRKMKEEKEEEEADGLEEDLIPQIHYEVCYPRPRNKFQNYGKASKSHDVTIKTGKKSSKKAYLSCCEWEDEDGLDYDEFDEEAFIPSTYEETRYPEKEHETSESTELVCGEVQNDYTPVSLGNVLVTLLIDAVCAETEPGKSKQRKRHRSKGSVSSLDNSDTETKDHIKVVDKEEIERFQPKDDEYVPHKSKNRRARKRERRQQDMPVQEIVKSTPLPPPPAEDPDLKFVKKISVQSLNSDLLRRDFGDKYVEGHCQPRRFVINLKPTVEEHLKNTGHERTAKTLTESGHQMMLLFEPFGCVNGIIGSKQPAYQLVRLKPYGLPETFMKTISHFTQDVCLCPKYNSESAYPWAAIKMEDPTLPKTSGELEHSPMCFTSICSVQQVIDIFKTKIAEMSPESFYRVDGAIGWAAKQPPVTLETVRTVSRIEWCASTPSEVMQQVQCEADLSQSNSLTDAKPTNCTICYENLLPSTRGTDASALAACGHWFCNECWAQHLRSRVKQGDINISCPEFDCKTPVDKVLLLAYLTPKEYRTQSRHHRNTTLNCQPDWTWCPNAACGRLVKMIGNANHSDAAIAVNCECGLLWCSSCKGEGHWPATCEQAAAYWRLIKRNGTIQWTLFSGIGDIKHVHVKKCPFCSNLIEKLTGCNYMFCVCKRAFCWDCLQDYSKHDWERCHRNKKHLQKVSLKQDKPIVTSMPGVALMHRERRARLAVMRRRKAAEILAKKAFLLIQGPKDPSLPCLPNIDDACSIASSSSSSTTSSILSVASYKSLPITWIKDDEASWQLLQELLETAANAAKFCSEAEFCLEHLEVLCNDPNTELRSPATLLQLKNRLIFIADQLHMIIHGELQVNADSAMGRVAILMHAGKKCLKWITANVPHVLSQDEEE
ncbi:uncharacterized protein [Amphiura filiformis]|uniref:uncharacterized protein isoform X2 n=1 Tax=Amphiura filiformis TaxID=82378 RepID=UPI003B21A6CF